MGYKCSFMDNELYSAQDVNERFSCFLKKGVVLGDSGNVLNNLNEATNEIVTAGVVENSCKVVYHNGVYMILPGTCIMHDGSAITFDEDGWELDVIPYTHQNVYILRNEPMNSINIMCGSEEPPENAVKLAEITNSGEIYDRRQYAKLKVGSTQEGGLKTFYDEYYSSELDEPKVKDVGTGNFSYVIIWYGYYGLDESDRLNLDCSGRCILPIDDDTPVSFKMLDFVGRTRFTFNVTKSGSILETSINPTSRTLDYGICYGVV